LRIFRPLILIAFILLSYTPSLIAAEQYMIDIDRSSIRCSVGYLIAGKIECQFEEFMGTIDFDSKNITKSSVFMEIKTESVRTGNSTWDNFIRSKRILNADQYPVMTFKSKRIEQYEGQYTVSGTLNLHGVIQEISFPFTIEEKKDVVEAKGTWLINRKDFNVIWHALLDKGGVIVGNHIKVEWRIVAVGSTLFNE